MSNAPPPPYEDATRSNNEASSRHTIYASSSHLNVPRNGIPTLHRRSMEDEGRPLPPGWVRQFDAKEAHQFFVDTNVNPPRSIWHHPYDDEQYLSTLSSEERERIEAAAKAPNHADIAAESSADESDVDTRHKKPPQPTSSSSAAAAPELPARPHPPSQHVTPHGEGGLGKLGRRMKDKLTGTTHEERERGRELRAQEEQEAYRRYQRIRSAMALAAETGQPQLLGKNAEGQDVYIEPPATDPYGNYVYPAGYSAGPYQSYNPYIQGPYANPNNRFIAYPRPTYAYGRPHGYGYGGGMGMPLVGGMLGGMMLGGLLW